MVSRWLMSMVKKQILQGGKVMKKILKKVFILTVCVASFLSMNMVTFASGDPYERILDEINVEYGTDIEYIQVDASEVSLEEYEKVTRKVAKEQKNLANLIAHRVECAEPLTMILATRETKHVTKDVWGYEDKYTIKATYDVEGNAVSNPRDIYASVKALYASAGYGFVQESVSTNIIDGRRTLAVTVTGMQFLNGIRYGNIDLYTEFTYAS